ncbi:MAG: hypothetical protein ACI36V_02740 [Coriobacteriales bacterium]
MAADWLRIPLTEVDKLDYLFYLRVRRDAFVSRLEQSEAGRDYLQKAWLLSRTEPDREASRRLFGRA